MARYEHLPIYKAALDVAVGFEKLVAGFSRYHKYTLGTELRNGSRRVLEQVVRANGARDRLPELPALRECLDSLLLSMRLAVEVRSGRDTREGFPSGGPATAVSDRRGKWVGKLAVQRLLVRYGLRAESGQQRVELHYQQWQPEQQQPEQ